MTKMRITVEEKVSVYEEIELEIPAYMDDDYLNDIVREVEHNMVMTEGSAEDMAYELEREYGIKILRVTKNFPETHDYKDFEVINIEEEK